MRDDTNIFTRPSRHDERVTDTELDDLEGELVNESRGYSLLAAVYGNESRVITLTESQLRQGLREYVRRYGRLDEGIFDFLKSIWGGLTKAFAAGWDEAKSERDKRRQKREDMLKGVLRGNTKSLGEFKKEYLNSKDAKQKYEARLVALGSTIGMLGNSNVSDLNKVNTELATATEGLRGAKPEQQTEFQEALQEFGGSISGALATALDCSKELVDKFDMQVMQDAYAALTKVQGEANDEVTFDTAVKAPLAALDTFAASLAEMTGIIPKTLKELQQYYGDRQKQATSEESDASDEEKAALEEALDVLKELSQSFSGVQNNINNLETNLSALGSIVNELDQAIQEDKAGASTEGSPVVATESVDLARWRHLAGITE